jgi:VIT family
MEDHSSVLVAGVAGLVAGAMAMAAGEYVSVHSQADTEKADLALERTELVADDEGEIMELAATTSGVVSIRCSQGRSRTSSWPMTPLVRTPEMNWEYPTNYAPVRSRPRSRQRPVSL